MPRKRTRGDEAADWIETYCTERGQYVRLTTAELILVRRIYDSPAPLASTEPITGRLAAYLALLHLAGIEHTADPPPLETPDPFTLWGACGPQLRDVLKREGAALVCPALGKSFPGRAA